MPEQLVPSIPITLDRERALKCDFNAIVLIQKYTGRNLFAGDVPVGRIEETLDATDKIVQRLIVEPDCIRGVLAALLTVDHTDNPGAVRYAMTPEYAGTLITAANLKEIIQKCSDSINSYFPARSKEAKAEESPLPQTQSPSA